MVEVTMKIKQIMVTLYAALEAIKAERQQVVSIIRYSEPRNRLPDPKGLLLARLPLRVMPRLMM